MLFLYIFALLALPAFADHCQGELYLEATGIGKNPSEARGKAKAEIAGNIISNIKSKTKITDSSKEKDGVFKEASEFEETSVIESDLTLFGFKEEFPKRQRNGNYELKVYICTKDASKGFLEKLRLLSDSLELAANAVLTKRHKNEAWNKTQRLYKDFMRTRNLLEVLGVESPYQADNAYDKAISYCRNAKVFWQDTGNECSETIFSMLSKKITMEKSSCSVGLKLSLSCPEKCASSSLEIECSLNPSLAVESCGGEKYSMLKTKEPVTGSSPYNKNKARENMIENLSNADFLNEWEREIMEWAPICE